MTQEEKQLLLKDLCARLPYGVMMKVTHDGVEYDIKFNTELLDVFSDFADAFKPYLRPMSSMTEDEEDELNSARMGNWGEDVDWLNANHFDYRGLIEKGLALEAPEGMYKND